MQGCTCCGAIGSFLKLQAHQVSTNLINAVFSGYKAFKCQDNFLFSISHNFSDQSLIHPPVCVNSWLVNGYLVHRNHSNNNAASLKTMQLTFTSQAIYVLQLLRSDCWVLNGHLVDGNYSNSLMKSGEADLSITVSRGWSLEECLW